MANEFKVKKGLIVHGSGSTILDVRGSQGQLFSVTDSLSGSLFSVGDISGIPIIDVRSDAKIGIGTSTPAEKLHVYGGNVLISGSAANTTLKIEDGATGAPITLQSSGGGEAFIYIGSELSSIRRTGGDLNFFANAIDMKFSTNNGSTSTLFLDTSHNATFAGSVEATGLTLTSQDPSLNFIDSSGSTYSAKWRFKDNDLQYLWGGGIKAYFTTTGIGIGDNGTTADARIERTGSSPYGLTFKTNNTSALSLDSSQNATFAGNVTVGSTSTNAARSLTIQTNAEQDSVLNLMENTGYGFSLNYDGVDNDFIIKRHDNSVAGVNVLTLFRENNNATFAGSVHLDNDAAQLQLGDGNDMQIFHNGANGEINISTGDFTIDSAGDITLDAGGADIFLKDDGTEFGLLANTSNNLVIMSRVQDKDIIFKGNDGGTTIEALKLDMSALGLATFSGNGVFNTALKINAPDGGGAPAMTAILNMHGYEGRGVGIKMKDNVNSASGATDREWFVGTGYNSSGFNIGYASDGSQSSYAAQAKLSIATNGDAEFAGTIITSPGASDQTSNADSATVPATTGAEFLRIQHPSYTNGQYTTEFAKIDRSGNLPVYIRQSKATANSFSNIARFGDHDTNNPGQFAVFGDMELDGFVIHGGDVDTKFGFNGANDFKVHTGGSDRFSVTGDVHVLGSTDFAIPAGRKLYLDGQNNTYITEGSDGVIDFYGDGTHLVSMKQNGTQNEVVINESSGDVDFRVEANNYSHAFFVEAQDKGYIGVGTDGPYNGTRMHILGDDTSPSFDGTAIDDTTLVLSNSDAAYGTVFGTFGNGDGVIQQRRMSSAVYYDLNLNPYGGNVGIGTTDAHDQLHVQSTLRVGPHFSSNDRDHIRLVPHGTDTRIQSPNERFHIENFLGHIIISASAVGGVGIANEGADVTAPSASLHVKSTTGDVLLVEGSGSTILDVQGSQGQLFSVSDQLTGSLFKVADISGIPVFEAFDDDRVIMGAYGQNTLYVKGSSTLGEGAVGINTNPSVGSGLHVVGVGTGKAGIRIGRDDGISTGKQLEFAVSSTYDALISGDANKLSLIPSGSSPSFEFNKSGAVKFSGYGSGTHSGTATKTLAVDSSGNVIEIDGGGTIDGSGAANRLAIWSDSDTLTSDSDFTVDGDTIFTTNLEASNNILAGGDVTVNGGDFNLTKQNGSPTINFLRDGTNPGTNTLLHYLNFKVDYDGAHQDWGGIEHRTNASSVRTDLRFNVKSQSGNVQTGLSIVGQPSAVPNSTFAGDLTVSGDLFASGTNGLKINTTADLQTSAERLTVNGLGVIRNSSDSAATLYIQNHSTTTSTIQPYIFLADSGGNRGGLGVETSTAIMSVNGQGGLKFQTGASGVAGSEALLIDNSQNAKFAGKVGIGTTAASFHADADDLVVGGGSGNTGITINSGTTGFGSIYFADGTADDATEKRGQIRYLQGTERMDFHTDNVATSAFSILANGNLKSNNSISAAGKIAVKSSGPHASYDFYNDGTSYFNGAVTIDSSITQTGTTADSVIASFAHNAFDSRQVGMPGRFMVGPLGNGYPSIGYNFTTGGDVYTKITNDTSWGIHFGVSNKMSFLYNAAGTGTFTWSELMSLNTSGNLSILGVALFNDGKGINFGNSQAKIYGSSSNGIQFNAGGSETMRLNQSGNLGIGTTSPTEKVDIDGVLRITRNIVSNTQYKAISIGSNRSIDDYGGLNKDYWRIGILTPGSSTTGESSAHGFGSLVFSGVTGANTTYVNRMVIEAGGNVGIGTNNPESKLTVEKNDATTYNAGDDGAQRDKGPTILLKNENTTDNSFGQIVFDSQGTDQGVARIVFLDTGTASTEMAFVTENSNSKGERMRISQGGNVGIGTSSPNISAFTTAVTLDANDAGYEIASSGTLTAILSGNSNGAGLHGIGAAGIRFFSAASGTTTERMRITSAGKVGIGTTSPGYLLSTAGTIRAEGMSTSPGSGVGLELRYDTSSNYGSVLSYDRANSAYKELRLEGSVINLREAGSNILTVDGGKVGIGTTSPGHLLEVRGTGDAVSIGNDTNNSSYIRFANTRGFVGYTGTDMMIQAGSGKNLRLGVNSNSFNNGVAMYVKSDGNVGIGTTSPTEKLAVNGNIETTTSGAGRKIGFNTGDNFSFNSTTIAHYGISNAGNETAGGVILSGYYGIRFASQGNIRGHISQAGLLTMANDVVAFGSPSDKSLKENIKPINNALDKVKNLKGVTFKWKEAGLTNLKEDIGFIAQDVQEVLPELVRENEDGKLSLRDKGIIPMLVEAVKELSAEVESLKKQLNK